MDYRYYPGSAGTGDLNPAVAGGREVGGWSIVSLLQHHRSVVILLCSESREERSRQGAFRRVSPYHVPLPCSYKLWMKRTRFCRVAAKTDWSPTP